MSHYEIKLFGTFQVLRDGEPIAHFRTQRARAIVAYLALFPKQHSRERLCDAIWPDALLEEGRSRLRQELSVLRKTLELPSQEELLIADRLTLGLRPGSFTTDVAAFERAYRAGEWRLAATLGREPLLEGFWDEWVLQERGRLELLGESAQSKCTEAVPLVAAPLPLALPLPLTRFFGRERELNWLVEALTEGTRLVSLTGPGGSGKTRLGIETVRALQRAHSASPVFVSCGDLEALSRLPEAVIVATGNLRQPLQDPLEQATEILQQLEAPLLVLDGIEQLVPRGAPQLVRTLLTTIPTLRCIVTSRQPLDLAGERELPVMPLAVPEQGLTAERMYLCASVRMFLDRIQAKRPEFSLNARNAEAIGEICRRLEGLPLGLELAAGRCRELSPEAFLERYSQRLHEIEARDRDIPARHRSLRALMEGSYRELTEAEQQLFARLSVFSGGWTLAAAEAICGEGVGEILDELATLRDRSLVFVEERGASQRWKMLELLRAFATELLPPDERRGLLRRHTRYCWENAATLLTDPAETANLRGAVEAAFEELADPALALELCVRLKDFWLYRGHLREGLAYLERALGATEGAQGVRAEGFRIAGILSRRAGDREQARQWQETALALYTAVGDEAGVAAVHNNLAVLARVTGDLQEALRQHREALALRRRLGDTAGVGSSLNNLGVTYRALGRGAEALESLQECLTYYETNSVGAGVVHINLGWVGLLLHDLTLATQEFGVGLKLALENDLTSWFPELWEGIGELAAQRQDGESAARLWGAAALERRRQGLPLAPEDQREHDQRQAALETLLGPERLATLLEEGKSLSLEAAQALAQSFCV
ncbi:tetratricopeptide repeat protein [Armatimonas rosea]|uniref:Putative ATPase n=1 Tax=Armatimonas rosea TaxID=685828 RepID=A0A7W9W9N4_ARMRO|nr:putative ATPase [Armatimonas rosea]